MTVTINKATIPAEPQAEPITTAPEKPTKRNNHSRPLDIQGIDLKTDQRLLLGHVLGFMKTTDSTLSRWIKEGKFPAPDGKQGRRPFWFSATIRSHVIAST
ncbi:MAG: hypothetical protein Q4G71_13655 [Pseudomonadota bacterium]|nr:hypothetical protein [Pseudomonadota bacterium]